MTAKKNQAADSETAAAGSAPAIARGSRWIIACALIVVITGGAAFAVWQQVREHVLARDEYRVDPSQIVMTPRPGWIHSDIAAEVLHDAGFDGSLSLMDPELTVRLATAFASHPWVAHVERVSKRYPSGIDVQLSYRKPVAMVEVPGGALPVDGEGVLLPTAGFSTADAEAYPRIAGIHTSPAGPVGSRWGDARVTGAARVAAVLAADWQALELARIEPFQRPARGGAEHVFTLVSRRGTKVEWGRAPASDMPGEIGPAEKIAQLRAFVAKHGSLDNDGPRTFAFLGSGELAVKPRPAIKTLPKNDE